MNTSSEYAKLEALAPAGARELVGSKRQPMRYSIEADQNTVTFYWLSKNADYLGSRIQRKSATVCNQLVSFEQQVFCVHEGDVLPVGRPRALDAELRRALDAWDAVTRRRGPLRDAFKRKLLEQQDAQNAVL